MSVSRFVEASQNYGTQSLGEPYDSKLRLFSAENTIQQHVLSQSAVLILIRSTSPQNVAFVLFKEFWLCRPMPTLGTRDSATSVVLRP